MSVTIQWLRSPAAILRIHPAPDALYGDAYEWWTVVSVAGDGVAELEGADRPLPPGGAKAVCDALRAAGFTQRTHTRIRDGKHRLVTKDLGGET